MELPELSEQLKLPKQFKQPEQFNQPEQVEQPGQPGRRRKKLTPAQRKRRWQIRRYILLSVCAVVLIASFWGISTLIYRAIMGPAQNPDEVNNDYLSMGESAEQIDMSEPLHNLIYNVVQSPISFSLSRCLCGADMVRDRPAPDFTYELNYEQYIAVFPYFGYSLVAHASYFLDGTLLDVLAREHENNEEEDTRIRIERGTLMDCIEGVHIRLPPSQTSVVNGTRVAVFMNEALEEDDIVGFQADFVLDGFAYRINLSDTEEVGKLRIAETLDKVILGGSSGLTTLDNPVIPDILGSNALTLEDARLDPEFGEFVPLTIPRSFNFTFANRTTTAFENSLYLEWRKPFDEEYLIDAHTRWLDERTLESDVLPFDDIIWREMRMTWRISEATESDLERIVSASDRESYEWSLYPVVEQPGRLSFFFDIPTEDFAFYDRFLDPVFNASELSLAVIRAREWERVWIAQGADNIYATSEAIDIFIPTVNTEIAFSVLYDDVIISVHMEGITPEQARAMFRS